MMNIKDDSPEIDEAIWQAWIKKNEARDRIRFARRSRVATLVLAVAALTALLWKFA